MKCKRAEYLVASLVSGTINERDRETLEKHLEHCPGCREVYERQVAIEAELRDYPSSLPENGFARQISNLVADSRPSRPRPELRLAFSLVTPFSALSIAFALVVAGIWVVFDGAFIEWIRSLTSLAEEIISTPVGYYYGVVLVSIIMVAAMFGIYRAVKES